MRSGGWMIPNEAVGELCLCMTADDAASTFSAGLIRADRNRLRLGANQDRKRMLSPSGLSAMTWLAHDAPLAENLLLHLDDATRAAILDYRLSGQRRVNQLFRLVQGGHVRREVVLTAAQQDDGPKRVRDARGHLRPEGIIILGHQGSHPRIAEALGFYPPPKGTWLSCRVVRADGAGEVEIDGIGWRLATPFDPTGPAPGNYV
jgi:hypothetical protein